MPATPSETVPGREPISEALLDVNVLIAAIFADHASHHSARSFVEALDRFHTTPTTQGGLLRFATRPWKDTGPRQFPPRLTMAAGIETLQQLTRLPGHVFTPDDLQYAELPADMLRGHKQWTDAYLMHLAKRHGLIFATLDSRMLGLDDPADRIIHVLK
jgi:toxin-antitoxin system PIN domain toxin